MGKDFQTLPIATFTPPATGTQLVVAFEPNCNSCWNAMENILAFARIGAVDGIQGIATGSDEDLAEFRRKFNASFPVQIITHELLHEVVGEFPVAWLVRNGRVEREFRKTVPSPYSLNLPVKSPTRPVATPAPAAPPSGTSGGPSTSAATVDTR